MAEKHSEATTAIQLDDLLTIEGLAQKNPTALNVANLRWQLRNRQQNGLASCCVRIGKRILISQARYEQWLATQTERGA
jgi:hypothetical protein